MMWRKGRKVGLRGIKLSFGNITFEMLIVTKVKMLNEHLDM